MMSDKEQIKAFADDLDRLVSRYANEFELSYGAVIGALFMKAQSLCIQAAQDGQDSVD